jgi:hypothetical protein
MKAKLLGDENPRSRNLTADRRISDIRIAMFLSNGMGLSRASPEET